MISACRRMNNVVDWTADSSMKKPSSTATTRAIRRRNRLPAFDCVCMAKTMVTGNTSAEDHAPVSELGNGIRYGTAGPLARPPFEEQAGSAEIAGDGIEAAGFELFDDGF